MIASGRSPETLKPRNVMSPSERFERKFYLPSSAIPFALHLLGHCCPADRRYPRGIIHSVYYDTADLEHYDESEQGSRTRKKVRIRWYDSSQDTAADIPVFVELKSKTGFAGSKQRKELPLSPQKLTLSAMRQGILPYMQILQILSEFDYMPESMLYPTLLISYQRLRFVDPMTGSRVSLDWNIRSTIVSPALDRGEQSLQMEGGVIEIKGQSGDLPPMLESMRLLETDWSRYSKYATCMQTQLEETGSFGRLTPSGRGELV